MNTYLIIYAALTIGMFLGFALSAVLSMSKDPATEKPDILTAEPREIVAVYEARREMEAMDADAIKAWEKEQAKKRKRR